MAVSPPATPDGVRSARPQSMYTANISPETFQKSRPQSMVGPSRSRSRLSMTSSRGAGTKLSDDDSKTAVKVVVRVRPPLQATDPGFDLIPQRFQRTTVNVPTDTSLSVESSQGRKIFTFDHVFGEETTQKGLWDYLEDSVDSFLLGYNVSILAYGQSGAGKSYTMGTCGPAEQSDPTAKGIIPRAATHLFDSLAGNSATHSRQNSGLKTPTRYSMGNINSVLQNARSNLDKSWQMSVTYVEIYNEQPRDLLLPEGSSIHDRSAVQIREDPKGRIFVEGLRSVPVNNVEELMAVLNYGSVIRQTDATAINSRSSRSHAVFTVNLRQVKPQTASSPLKSRPMSTPSESGVSSEPSTIVESKLHFVDLAGSERLKNTGATGDRAREGISINAGLASLGKVISQLSSRSGGGYVSYRDSKLTRMLQDSLGGNAITYMVACVTPAEFHLSETLNTVQYAQRARNIQSKPKIQHINEDADKQQTIERLRTEVAFLRQHIRNAENGERKKEASRERTAPADLELQIQLLDVQEGYRALSERHARLIAELTGRDQSPDSPTETAAERLKRSQDNQQQIEQIILEYEKTIQTLQSSLSTTRSSLALTESTLLEKETKCAYIETMNQQLNARVQKLMDRETSTEQYLHELELRLEDSASGTEKQDGIVAELRREMQRVRESESNAEDYISTLEERLAEADQDMEIMQRELERLEQLVERQRSLGKLDNLLYELDQVQRNTPHEVVPDHEHHSRAASVSGSAASSLPDVHMRKKSEPMEIIQEAKEGDTPRTGEFPINGAQPVFLESMAGTNKVIPARAENNDDGPSPAQSRFMQEKFENVSQELFDLRLEHESSVNEFDLLAAKYQEALRTLAEMQGQFDEARSTPVDTLSPQPVSRSGSFMSGNKSLKLPNGGTRSSSRSLSLERSTTHESTTSLGQTASIHTAKETPSPDSNQYEIERLQSLVAEHEQNINTMKDEYSQLHNEHQGTLDTVEKLKHEARRSQSPLPTSPGYGMIRRPTSQLGNSVDRAQRSLATLRGLIIGEFDGDSNRIDAAEVHLSAATHELQSRMQRIQSLESELHNVKKEMEAKSTIISGLTRERNSLKSGTGTPVDLSMVSQMRDQLIQKETELKTLHEGYGQREQELQTELAAVRKDIETLSTEYGQARKSLGDHENLMKSTTTQLEVALSSIETLKTQQATSTAKSVATTDEVFERAAVATATHEDSDSYQGIIDGLKREIERQMSTNVSHSEKIEELTQMHEAASKDIHEHSQIIQEKCTEIEQHRVKIAALQTKVKEAEAAVEFHKHGLKSLHESHGNEVEELKLSHAGMLAGYDDQIMELNIKHGKALTIAESELKTAESALENVLKTAQSALGHETSVDMVGNHIQDLIEEKKHVAEANKRLVSTNAELEAQLRSHRDSTKLEEAHEEADAKIAVYKETIRNLANEIGNHEDTIREKETVVKRHEEQVQALQTENLKKIALIEELEQQLQRSYDQHHNRVSVIQQQGSLALTEAQQRITLLEKEIQKSPTQEEFEQKKTMLNRPQSPLTELAQRSDSVTSNLRKSASIVSLPSPPPAIPLPPLPSLATVAGPSISGPSIPGNPSPPQSRHTSKEVAVPQNSSPTATTKDNALIKRQSAIIEDQESRLRTMEKHLHAEKQLTATLEEALVDLETQSNKLRGDAESWKKKACSLADEVSQVKREHHTDRQSMHAVEEEVRKRRAAEDARAQLEERMKLLKQNMDAGGKKKKKSALNCF